MCGICGIFGAHDRKVIKPMTESLTHRGPDDLGYFYHRDLVSLGHRRLSIIGLDSGKQPIFNEDKSIAVVFNGEIYNYKELRTSLESQGHKFVTNTDTEVIPHLYEQYGEDFANHLNGDFSIALFDSRFEILYLIRDRFGIRSIYYHRDESGFVFGSEIKALRASGMVSTELDREALNYYMTLRYVPDEMTLFQGVRKVKPGTMVKLTKDSIEFKKWYNLKYSEDYQTSENEQVEQFRDLLSDAVRLRMRSDVPVGAFLSGGIDSSVIVAMAAEHTNDMKTFSVGFRSSVDENADARRLAEFIGTDHHDFYVGKDDYKEITGIVRRMDEPIGDFILLPTYLLNRHASEKVKVVLTGEGADEILGGYLHHLILNRIWDYRKLLGKPVTSAIAMGLKQMPPSFLNMFFPYPAFLGEQGKAKLLGLLGNISKLLPSYLNFAGFYSGDDRQSMLKPEYFQKVMFEHALENCPIEAEKRFRLNTVIDMDMNSWLPDYTLLKQDRLTMMNSIEGRVPFLDHRLVEMCATLPPRMKNNFMTTKHVLREAARPFIPERVTNQKKRAFYIPTEEVFGKEYETFIREQLLDGPVNQAGIFESGFLEEVMNGYGSNEIIDNKRLNLLLIFGIWYNEVFSNQ